MKASETGVWYKVLDREDELPDERVMVVNAGHKDIALTRFEGNICALDNKCPHQGGPLGEGAIEGGFLRCPWHGWDFHPCSGKPPGGFDDGVETFPVEIRKEGVFVELKKEGATEKTVSDLMVETMLNWGVDTVFGMVGHSNLGFADAIRKAEENKSLRFIDIRHEGAASFAASAYGKLTGRPAACFGIAGPGSTNMYTGLWDAKVDRAPILALTGQVTTQVVGTGAFQEIDLVAAFQSVASFNHRVQPNSQHAELMSLAIKHALLNRDVSHLTFPDEVQQLPCGESNKAGIPEGRITALDISPPEQALEKSLEMIRKSKKPVIIAGHGARFNKEEVMALAEQINAPVLTTFKGKGLISDQHPLGCGVLGRSGTPVASWFMNESDLLIVLGASFSNHTGITDKKPLIQVDYDPMALSKFHRVDAAVWGEIGRTLKLMATALEGHHKSHDPKPEIHKRWSIWRKEKHRRMMDDRGKGLNSALIFDTLSRLASENAIMTVDVGNNAYSFGRYFESTRQSFLMSGYLGSIGFGYPAAMGAWAAGSGRPVICVTGDGGFAQYMGELNTAVKYRMPIKHILLNNSELGKISKEQRALKMEVWKTRLSNPNFATYAENCGALGVRVENATQLESSMKRILSHDGPAMLEIITDVSLV